jgi:hypothetical protein
MPIEHEKVEVQVFGPDEADVVLEPYENPLNWPRAKKCKCLPESVTK